jgi:hypothetical protein
MSSEAPKPSAVANLFGAFEEEYEDSANKENTDAIPALPLEEHAVTDGVRNSESIDSNNSRGSGMDKLETDATQFPPKRPASRRTSLYKDRFMENVEKQKEEGNERLEKGKRRESLESGTQRQRREEYEKAMALSSIITTRQKPSRRGSALVMKSKWEQVLESSKSTEADRLHTTKKITKLQYQHLFGTGLVKDRIG